MILVRTAYTARAVEACLMECNIPYIFIGGTKCRRAFKTDQLCALNFDQGLKPPVIGMAVDKCNVFAKFGTSSGLVGIL